MSECSSHVEEVPFHQMLRLFRTRIPEVAVSSSFCSSHAATSEACTIKSSQQSTADVKTENVGTNQKGEDFLSIYEPHFMYIKPWH